MESPFRDHSVEGLKVIETLRWSADQGFQRRSAHLARAAATCGRLGFPFDVEKARQALGETVHGDADLRLRMTVSADGTIEATAAKMPPSAAQLTWTLRLSEMRVRSSDPWLGVKTTNRAMYDQARAAMTEGVDEVIFANERDELCEGSITSLFLDFGEGLVTPVLTSGLLPGVLRAELISTGAAREAVCRIADLNRAKAVWVGNSLRGLVPCKVQLYT